MEQTPLMKQYWEIKNAHQDKIVLFRMGDFYEMFHDDANTAAPLLGIALTKRNQKSDDDTPMCGVPHHSISNHINKLLKFGHKVAICDQVEDPKLAKGIVKRAVTRVLTPGMVYDPDSLDQTLPNYMASLDNNSISFLDITTGEAFFYRVKEKQQKLRLLQVLSPKEVVIDQETPEIKHYHLSVFNDFKCEKNEIPESAQRLLAYAQEMQPGLLNIKLKSFEERPLNMRMELNPNTLRHLEVFETNRGDERGSLFHAVNRTKTAAGSRRLRNWLAFPLTEKNKIEDRHNQIDTWLQRPEDLKIIRDIFSSMGDVERRIGKLSNPNFNARDLLAISQSLEAGLRIDERLDQTRLQTPLIKNISSKIFSIIVDEPPLSTREGGLIRAEFSKELKEVIELSTNSHQQLMEMEAREKQNTGINSLKIKYNNVFGYFIEVTHTHAAKVPPHYKRKQTLATAERFITDELVQLETKILSAKQRRSEMEYEIFSDLKAEVDEQSSTLLTMAHIWCDLDVVTSFAWLSLEKNYSRPKFTIDKIELIASRHPVIEQEIKSPFVPNNIMIQKNNCILLTGPNMAGKSTLMRQTALASILAQCGCFVPAAQAELPIFQRILTRIGASDLLTEGLSTFMVEMKETAELLKSADEDSLVILDEIGRGTSTFDGMSLAQAILEHILTHSKSYSLFATHYHELTKLEEKYPQITNSHMSIKERGGDISFLHTLTEGAANKSYGIHVARLAGLPKTLTDRAEVLLKTLESTGPKSNLTDQLSLFSGPKPAEKNENTTSVVRDLESLDLEKTTPLESFQLIIKWKNELKA